MNNNNYMQYSLIKNNYCYSYILTFTVFKKAEKIFKALYFD